jgi:hypothetical protein
MAKIFAKATLIALLKELRDFGFFAIQEKLPHSP